MINEFFDETKITMMSKYEYKRFIKQRVKEAVFKNLLTKKDAHTKISDIKYTEFSKLGYINSTLFTNSEVSLLLALRTHTVKGIKRNTPSLYRASMGCPLQCQEPEVQDRQEHLQLCPVLLAHLSSEDEETARRVPYSHIYGSVLEQKEAVIILSTLLDTRERLLQC